MYRGNQLLLKTRRDRAKPRHGYLNIDFVPLELGILGIKVMVYLVFNYTCRNGSGSNGSSGSLTPAVSSAVKIGLTATYIALYFILFVVVYLQLWLILYYRYKRISFQTVFLFLCATWSGLRTTLFSFYIHDTSKANTLPIFWDWLLYCFPVCLQFFTLCLLNLYFSQVMFKAKPRYAANPRKFKNPLRLFCFTLSAIFLAMNLACAIVVYNSTSIVDPDIDMIKKVVTARVVVNDTLFIIGGAWLTYCIVRISKTTSANILLEAKGTTVCQASTVGVVILLLYTSRAIYNLLAISPLQCKNQLSTFNFDWYNVSDQADFIDVNDLTFVLFGVVLFVWELLPTTVVIIFFRVRRPVQSMVIDDALNAHSCSSRVYFFDNPHRYDSDDDCTGSFSNREETFRTLSSHGGSVLGGEGYENSVNMSSNVLRHGVASYPSGLPSLVRENQPLLSHHNQISYS